MKIFLSHSHAQAATADALAIALRQDGHEVFLDSDALKAADGYHTAIREQIAACDLFLFLVSPQALEAGHYTLTEMGIARERWPDPSGHVLPVIALPVPFEDIPPYLKAVTLLQPRGDLVAETVARVAALQRRPRRRLAVGLSAGLALLLFGGWWIGRPAPPAPPCLLDAALLEGPRVTTLEAGPAGALRSFVIAAGQASLDIDALTTGGDGWIIEASASDGRVMGRFVVTGCPAAPTELHDAESGLRLRLAPRP